MNLFEDMLKAIVLTEREILDVELGLNFNPNCDASAILESLGINRDFQIIPKKMTLVDMSVSTKEALDAAIQEEINEMRDNLNGTF